MKRVVIIILLIFNTFIAASQPHPFHFSTISTADGLSQSDVTAIVQDNTGFMWFATNNGLTRYDGNRFAIYKADHKNPGSISCNTIFALTSDETMLWIGSREGVDRYDTLLDKFSHYNRGIDQAGDTVALTRVMDILVCKNTVWVAAAQGLFHYDWERQVFRMHHSEILQGREMLCLTSDRYGRLFIGTNRGILLFDPDSDAFSVFSYAEEIQRRRITALLFEDNCLWIGSKTGCFMINQSTGTVREITCDGAKLYRISAILRDSQHNIWISSRENGVYKISDGKVMHIVHNPRDPASLSGNDVLSLCEDLSGMIWIGTSAAGVNCMPLRKKPFTILKYNPYDGSGLSDNVVSAICPDNDGTFWIATKDGCLNRYDARNGATTHYAMAPKASGAGAYVRISALLAYDAETLYVGSGNGLYRFDKRTKSFTLLFPEKLGGRYISTLYRTYDGRIWCGSNGGLFVLSAGGITDEYTVENGRLTNNNIRTFFEDSYGSLWIGTRDGGLHRFDRTGASSCRTIYDSSNCSINSDDIAAIFEDRERRIWIGTWGGGLSLMEDRNKPVFRTFTERDGLSDNVVFSISEDASGKLWLSTYNGLSCFNPVTGRFRNYSVSDGLAGNEFSVGAFYRMPDHTLLLGGTDGVTIFNPQSVETEYRPSPRYTVTELTVNNQSVHPGQRIDGQVLLHNAAFATRRLVFPSKVRSFSLYLASFDYAAPHAGSFACKLEGFDDEWIYATTRQPLVYANLNPGSYTFMVRGVDDKDIPETLLQITIKPPLWANPVAYTFYGLVLLIAVAGAIARYTRRVEKRNELLHERLQQESAEEIYNAKMRFYTNISHELRTPLTLIVGLTNALGEQHSEDETMVRQITVIRRNAELLQRLINELLDLRRIETGNMTLQREERDVVAFTRTILSYFEQTASNRNITMSFTTESGQIRANLDFVKVEKIIYNLLSNAIKFANTRIDTSIRTITGDNGQMQVEIRIQDDGKGIREEDIDRIFLRFYRNEEDNSDHTGAGIGLNFALEIARLHGGDIKVESARGAGAAFIVILPVESGEKPRKSVANPPSNGTEMDRPMVLLIDDNPDMRYYIAGLLEAYYDIQEASDGSEALRLAAESLPDIILCDIMMPGIDGMEVCRRFKTSPRTGHIPIIMVTAKGSDEARIKGLEIGADAYIIKPFSESHLRAQIASLLSSREQIRSSIRREVMTSPHPAPLESDVDRKLHSIVELIDRNLSNPDYTVEQLSKDLFISRMQLYRLLKNEVGQTPGEFLRNYRLNAAARLLDQHKINVSEVGYMVGFVDIRYFRQCFKHKFGLSPREYTQQKADKER